MQDIERALSKLRAYVEREKFRGYDPYDTLNASLPFARMGKWLPAIAIQIQKRNPINLRPILGIRKEENPKGIGLLLHAYATLYQWQKDTETLETAKALFEWLVQHPSEGYSGYCWGYNFDWANPGKYLKAFTPSIVVTGFVGKGLFKYYQATGDQKALEVLRSACEFILEDLPRSEDQNGICFSYTPIQRDACYNASMLGAELFVKVASVTGEARLLEMARRAVDFVVAHQHADGRWDYSLDLETGEERRQIDFHQGYVLESLDAYIAYSGTQEEKYHKALKQGAAYYRREQFFESGQAKWRVPRVWPVDIHNQAQGIISFTRLSYLDAQWLSYAETVARWTIRHMQDKAGYFYYRRGRFITNRISYMRWAQAWMIRALAELCAKRKSVGKPDMGVNRESE